METRELLMSLAVWMLVVAGVCYYIRAAVDAAWWLYEEVKDHRRYAALCRALAEGSRPSGGIAGTGTSSAVCAGSSSPESDPPGRRSEGGTSA